MDYDFNPEKDTLLKGTRGIGFDKIIEAVNTGSLIVDVEHFNKAKYPKQNIFVVKVENYVYVVPYVWDAKRKVKFLKTIYPSRKLTKKYLKI